MEPDATASALASLHTNPMMISLVVDGIMAGVGGILSFLPNIFILFLALAFLEDSGYMSRVAYVMNGIMGAAAFATVTRAVYRVMKALILSCSIPFAHEALTASAHIPVA